MEPEVSLLCSKQPATVLILIQMHAAHKFPLYLPKISSDVVFYLRLGLPNGLFS